jgi:ribonuclease P/MRP protein subunit RPP40
MKIDSKVGTWLYNFLAGRSQFIVLQNQLSKSSKVISGISQGTVLGPVLALIFLSDIDNNLENVASMFADDTRLLVDVEEDVENLQEGLDRMYNWAKLNNMEFNCTKLELLRYGRKSDLKATFNEHITKVCQKVKQKAGWILRTFHTRNQNVMKHLLKQLVQPHVDYCSQMYMLVKGRNLADIDN